MTQFHGKTKICYGRYALETLEELPSTSAFVVTDPFMVKSGFAEQVTSHLERRGLPHLTFAEVEPDPSLETVMRGTLDFIRSKADLIVALGGGSAIDTAKAIAAGANAIIWTPPSAQQLQTDMMQRYRKMKEDATPVISRDDVPIIDQVAAAEVSQVENMNPDVPIPDEVIERVASIHERVEEHRANRGLKPSLHGFFFRGKKR